MKKDELVVTSLLSELLGETLNYYISNLTDSAKSVGDDDPYSRARSVIKKLSLEEQEKIFNFLKLVIVDTTSTVLGTIDGSHFPPNIDGDFTLEYEGDEIQGSLQDELISKAEEIGIYK
ncbi:hypothetical protein [Enterobacillus tribolii]|uniref:Uncharacterized protein n=1 Tax=Enterobacillus tribolii TaxID=1487935 RepID=A0A370QHA4_9GAMM|nr:hypothetical protein [Enterobacillus tribolii]MBW7982459.1 hypothetical protein [Enterobacillus tribolii]RDK87738.1 hypothetical protein C8D90_1085 [Enterobacillus tribolii]